MAVVYLARDLKLDRLVALKVFLPQIAAAIGAERFLREIDIASRLSHPHILPLYDSGQSDGILYYVMPYVQGESLRERLDRERQLPLEEALHIARNVAAALAYAHSMGIVHRDVKPENILLEGDEAIVADFGIARAIEGSDGQALTQTGVALGTPAYMSPEQCGGGGVDGRSDIYALACVLFEMLAGEPPFTGPSTQAVVARHLQERPPSLAVVRPGLPLSVDDVLARALAKVPADRYRTVTQFIEALGPAATSGPVTLPRRRPRWGVVAAGVVAVALALWGATEVGRRLAPKPAAAGLDPRHIAVLYFEDVSEGGRLAHVASGLTHDLIDALSQVSALHVIGADGVKPFRDRPVLLDSIARALDVGTIASGTVDSAGDRLRVKIRLTDASSGRQLQTGTIERPWGDIRALNEEIIGDVSRLLRRWLGAEVLARERRSRATRMDAWEMVQRADHQWDDARSMVRTGSPPVAFRLLREADSMLAKAARLDPGWTTPRVLRGWVAFRAAQMAAAWPGLEGREDSLAADRWLARGIAEANDALAIEPGSPKALEVRGVLRSEAAGRPGATAEVTAQAIRDLEAAVGGDPSLARAWFFLSTLYRYTGRFDEANRAASRALEADAFLLNSPQIYANLFFSKLNQEDYDEAGHWCDQGRRYYPEDIRLRECEIILLAWSGRTRADAARAWRAVTEMERDTVLVERRGNRRLLVAAVLARAGLADSAAAVLRRVAAAAPDSAARVALAYDEAHVWLLLGDRRRALERLAAYLASRPDDRSYVAASPWFRPLQSDSAFRALTAP